MPLRKHDLVEELILRQGTPSSYRDCEQAYRDLRSYIEEEEPRNILHQPVLMGSIWTLVPLGMRATDLMNPQRIFDGIQACPLNVIDLRFDLTNPNKFDMRLSRFFVDVVEFVDVSIMEVFEGGRGGGGEYRRFACEIEAKPGRYACRQLSDGFDYLRLTFAEMEAFGIEVTVPKAGVYRLRVAVEYSIAGDIGTKVSDDVMEIGFFDSTLQEIKFLE